jgi:hypothetical protein
VKEQSDFFSRNISRSKYVDLLGPNRAYHKIDKLSKIAINAMSRYSNLKNALLDYADSFPRCEVL